jgi:1-acyl-sn-glycerol-3-phosphate acyltransferase
MGIWHMKAAFKLLRAVLHLLRGYWIIRTQFSKIAQQQRESHVQQWSAQLLTVLGIDLRVIGTPIQSGLLVANHISWLDNVAIHAAHFARFVAKSDIKSWLLIGYLTDQSGMLFVERTSRKDSHRVVQTVAEQLRKGDCVAVFPEGTTSDGNALLPFHANMIQSAIDADCHIQPVAIRYTDTASGQQSFAPCFVGDDTLFRSVWRTLNANSVTVSLQFGKPQMTNARDRRTWAHDLRASIHTMLIV